MRKMELTFGKSAKGTLTNISELTSANLFASDRLLIKLAYRLGLDELYVEPFEYEGKTFQKPTAQQVFKIETLLDKA